MGNFWDDKYGVADYVYGKEPNSFFREQLGKLKSGRILLPADGEGRNAVYAARQGWEVEAYDFSETAVKKALKLAGENNVQIKFLTASHEEFEYRQNYYDVAGLIYVHLPPALRMEVHRKVISSLRHGGIIILEAFAKEQLSYTSGGPKDISMLYSADELKSDFISMDIRMLAFEVVKLDEGEGHKGDGAVIRMLAVRP